MHQGPRHGQPTWGFVLDAGGHTKLTGPAYARFPKHGVG